MLRSIPHSIDGLPAEDAIEQSFPIDRVDFLLDSPDFVFIVAFQGGVLHQFPQPLLSLTLYIFLSS